MRGESFELDVENLSHEGRGVARLDGKTMFVNGALRGERVVARRVRKRRRYDECALESVLLPSPDRVAPRCAHAAVCGGCMLQHLDPLKQVEHKQSVLLEHLQHQAGLSPERVLAPLTGPLWGYRRKARLGVKHVPKKGGALVGFREKYAPYIADIDGCPVLHPAIGERLLELRELINGLSIPHRIPQLEVAVGDEDAAIVMRHLEPLNDADFERLLAFETATGISIYLQPGDEHSVYPLTPATAALHYRVGDLRFEFQPTDFTQVNAAMNRMIVEQVRDLLAVGPNDRVLDLFCGLGNFTLAIAPPARHVIGVEGSASLIDRARANAKGNQIENCEFVVGDLADPADLTALSARPVDKMLLDPPRSGADVALKTLNLDAVARIVYVSCNPVTLARDAGHLVAARGFALTHAGVMDMFPHTAHVESVAVFDRR